MSDDAIFRTVKASQVRPRRMRWLMRDRIPLGAFTLVVGDGGLGKTTWCLDVAAKLSRGELDGDLAGQPAGTLILSAEDDAETTIIPRLMAAGADLDRITLLADREDGLYVPPWLPDDQDALVRCIEVGVRFVLFDPLVAFLSAKTNSWKTQDVRAALGPMSSLARRFDLAVGGIMHLNKGTSSDPSRRMGESTAFRNAARSALVVGADPDDPRGKDGPRRVVAQDKANLAPPGLKSLAYEIESVTVYGPDNEPITATRLECLGEHRARAEDLLAPRTVDDHQDEPHELDVQLYEQLTAIPRPQSNLIEAIGLERTDGKARRRLDEMKNARYIDGGGRKGWWRTGNVPPWWEVSPEVPRDTTAQTTHRHNGYHDPSLVDGLEDELAHWGLS